MPRRPEQFEKIREKSREKILSAALELFANKGYDATSIDSIAKKAKVSKGLIYNYYKSKKQLLMAMFEDAMGQGMAMFERHKSKKDPYERLRAIIEDFFEMVESNRKYLKLLFVISLQPGVLKDTKLHSKQMYAKNQEMIGMIYNEASGGDPNTGLLLDALMDGIMLNYIRFGSQYPLAELKKKVIADYCTKRPKRKK